MKRTFGGNRENRTALAALALSAAFALCVSLASSNALAKERSKVIDFEDEVVEGMNKRPLDSLSQVSEREKRRRKMHLYRKRVGFSSETEETLRDLRYQ